MTCPHCGSRHYSIGGNGCDACGYWPTQTEKEQDEERLRAIVRERRNWTQEAVEAGGIEFQ